MRGVSSRVAADPQSYGFSGVIARELGGRPRSTGPWPGTAAMAGFVRVTVTALAIIAVPALESLVEDRLSPPAPYDSGFRLRGSIAFNGDFQLRGSVR